MKLSGFKCPLLVILYGRHAFLQDDFNIVREVCCTLRPHEVAWGPVSLWVRFLERYLDPLKSPEKVEEYMSSVAEIAKDAFSTM